jgi:hypothetical protein
VKGVADPGNVQRPDDPRTWYRTPLRPQNPKDTDPQTFVIPVSEDCLPGSGVRLLPNRAVPEGGRSGGACLSAGWKGKIRHQASQRIRLGPSRHKREYNDRRNKNPDGD